MTYRELYQNALWDLELRKITLGEFDERVKPLNQELKTGHWLKLPYMAIDADGTLLFAHVCSSCNGIGYFRKSENEIVGGLFCPNCGAKMVESEGE